MPTKTTEDVVAPIRFIIWQQLYNTEKPFQIFIQPPKDAKDQRTNNLVFVEHETTIRDIRGSEEDFNLDHHGFQFCNSKSKFEDFENMKAVEQEYLPEIKRLIESEVKGADRVHFFDWRLRRSSPIPAGTVVDLCKPTDWLRPSIHAHVDNSPSAILNRIMTELPDEAELLLQGRLQVINVWKPLHNPVEDWPLAVADGSTISLDDLIDTDHVRRYYAGSVLNLMHRPDYKWYYLSQQNKDEVLFIKNFDSDDSVKASLSTCCVREP
ncbi:uncharacterized protein K444DRAFT_218497 [Hyaloscypha bicolor E]|uniref:Methyltransferase CmcJ n=1 Tax=Hyaloscypha bicolor E TaxID=1095630 RepID=A0A2J6SP25_9HELO|nr:uncharacterized protein K444DRAFT_218497 [Hyaloscypha bicolor E]PMD52525.1 hypothetical protein K444DRAFT_218497 [Hyaloscypha bicolor E]